MIFHAAASRIRLLVQLRWLTLILQAAGMYPALTLGWLDRRWVTAYIATILIVAGINCFAAIVGSRRRPCRDVSEFAVFAHLGLDVLALAALLCFTGGPWNPLAAMFYVNIAISCMLLKGRWQAGFLVFVLAVLLFMHASQRAELSPVLLFSQLFVACLIWGMARFLVRSVRDQYALVDSLERDRSRRQRWEAISTTAAGFAHKLATPLNNVKIRLGRLKAMGDPRLATELESAVKSLDQAEAHLKAIIAASLERKQCEAIHFQAVNLKDYFGRFVRAQSEEGMVLAWQDDFPREATCTLPTKELSEALRDLVVNAWEASSRPFYMQGRRGSQGGTFELAIKDQGPGFSRMVLERFGEPFLTTKQAGAGLGLYNAKNLCWALGGHLSIENQQDGALVTMCLPLEGLV